MRVWPVTQAGMIYTGWVISSTTHFYICRGNTNAKHLPESTKFIPSGTRISDNFQWMQRWIAGEWKGWWKQVLNRSPRPIAQFERYTIPILWDREELRLPGSSWFSSLGHRILVPDPEHRYKKDAVKWNYILGPNKLKRHSLRVVAQGRVGLVLRYSICYPFSLISYPFPPAAGSFWFMLKASSSIFKQCSRP